MKNVIKILSKTSVWNDLIGIAALVGLIISHDIKSTMVFGILYLGSCIREVSK